MLPRLPLSLLTPLFRDGGQYAARKAPVNLKVPVDPSLCTSNVRQSSLFVVDRSEGDQGTDGEAKKGRTEEQFNRAGPQPRSSFAATAYCTVLMRWAAAEKWRPTGKVQTRKKRRRERKREMRRCGRIGICSSPSTAAGDGQMQPPVSALGGWISYSRSPTNLY